MTVKLGSWLYDTDRKLLYYVILDDNGDYVDMEPAVKLHNEEFHSGQEFEPEFEILNDKYTVPIGILNKVKTIEMDRRSNFRNAIIRESD